MRSPTLLLLLLLPSCVNPSFVASRTVDLSLPAADLQTLSCESHNGSITVNGDPTVTTVEVHAELSVRGYSQGEADDNLRLMSVGQDAKKEALRIFGNYPVGSLNNRSPSFTFTMKVPQNVQVKATSHNGDIRVTGTRGNQSLNSHNGDIEGSLHGNRIEAQSHNGRVVLQITTEGQVDGTIESHNGNVEVQFAEKATTTLAASTHNGSIEPGGQIKDANIGRSSLRGRIGDGKGSLTVSTHNGDVRIR
ncbi:MAG: DUF4097 family beta strand repeat protein [Planctomycetes bacterium]|jgi:DUF4097 and DUF4098 domain-containing protein YvlB|nr:DUF4097 family beta strand repeat protein [Planctomycetota bacterium]MCC7064009.1 DUF4097 family beta strand repeat protein [Planctomycetota bacterium]